MLDSVTHTLKPISRIKIKERIKNIVLIVLKLLGFVLAFLSVTTRIGVSKQWHQKRCDDISKHM